MFNQFVHLRTDTPNFKMKEVKRNLSLWRTARPDHGVWMLASDGTISAQRAVLVTRCRFAGIHPRGEQTAVLET